MFFMLNTLFLLLAFVPFVNKENRIYASFLKGVFVAINSIGLLMNCVDFSYFKFTLKRSTAELFFIRNDVGNLLGQYLIDYWYVALIWFFLSFLLFKFYPRNKVYENPSQSFWKKGGSEVLFLILLSGISLLGIRGGFQLKPLRVITAAEYTESKNIPLVINTPFSIIKSVNANYLSIPNYYNVQDPESLYPFIHQGTNSEMKKQNVVLIILESFSKEYIGYFNQGKGFTPFLDSLIPHAFAYENSYANGKKSIEGVPAILASIPSLMENPYLTSVYGANQISGLGTLLQQKGYSTSFFHGGSNGTMGFDVFCKFAGFKDYYGRNEYNNENDFDGNWGIFDEPFYGFFKQKLDNEKQPFCSAFFSLSSHHPYSIPQKYKSKFPKGTLEIHQSIAYADYALRSFFEESKKSSWFKNTLFVITADHTSLSENAFFQSKVGSYAIPILFYSADESWKGKSSEVAQQIDIIPTLLSRLNYNSSYFSFGKSLLEEQNERYGLNYSNGIFQSLSKTHCFHFDGEKAIGFYDLKTDSLLNQNLLNENKVEQKLHEENLKKFIQHFNYVLIENKMTVK